MRRDRAVQRFTQNFLFTGAIRNEQHLACLHNRHHTHGYRLARNVVFTCKEARISLDSGLMQVNDMRVFVKYIRRLVKAYVTVKADAQQL